MASIMAGSIMAWNGMKKRENNNVKMAKCQRKQCGING
jgi:hypothetical protein